MLRSLYIPITRHRIQPVIQLRAKSSSATSGRLVNADIPHKIVTIVQSDGKLAPNPVRLASLLREIDQTTQFIELVTEKPNPIVKIRDKKEAREQESILKEKRASTRIVTKDIKVSWVISSGDLDHKLSQMRQIISKGHKVSVVFAAKPGQLPPPRADCDQVINSVVDGLKNVAKLQRTIQEGKGITLHTRAYFASRDKNGRTNESNSIQD